MDGITEPRAKPTKPSVGARAVEIIPFRAQHLEAIDVQAPQRFASPFLTAAHGRLLEGAGVARTAVADGEIVGCAGLVPIWDHRAVAWALLAETTPALFFRAHRAARRFLERSTIRRIETYVRSDHAEGHRWARALGFEFECGPLRHFDPFGHDYDVYVRFHDV